MLECNQPKRALFTPHYDERSSYCGPTAMSAVTGLPVSLIKQTLRDLRMTDPRRRVRLQYDDGSVVERQLATRIVGVGNDEMLKAMTLLGWRVIEQQESDNNLFKRNVFRLGDFLEAKGHDGPFIVNVTHHYIAVGAGEACDTYTKIPIDIARWRRGRKRWVQRWWKFAPIVEPNAC